MCELSGNIAASVTVSIAGVAKAVGCGRVFNKRSASSIRWWILLGDKRFEDISRATTGSCTGVFFSVSVGRVGGAFGSCVLTWVLAISFSGVLVTVLGRVIGSGFCANALDRNTKTMAMRIGTEGFFMIAKRGVLTPREAKLEVRFAQTKVGCQ